MLSNQEIYNRAAGHLLTQSQACYKWGTWQTVLANSMKQRDALGCLIKRPAFYLFNRPARLDHFTLQALGESGVPVQDQDVIKLLEVLAFTHDKLPAKAWKQCFYNIAMSHNLAPYA